MIDITRVRRVSASAAAIFTVLADPGELGRLLPRVRRVEVLAQGADYARIATYMAFGPFGDIRNEGEARWTTNREVRFVSPAPVRVETRWTLEPVASEADITDVRASIQLDLAPLLGPIAAFVPPEQVQAMVAPDLEHALAALAARFAVS